jgi:DNA polymerase
MQIELTQEEAARSVRVYRETYPEVVRFWKELQDAAISATRNPTQEFMVGPISFYCLGKKVLCVRLPSGRALHYVKPRVSMIETEGKYGTYKRAQIFYEGKDQKTHNWGTSILIGSKICENIVQAIARDILVHGMKQATKAGFDIVLHVHDEIGALVQDGSHLTLALLCQCMTTGLEWAPDLPLEASGYEEKYYKK